MGNNSSSGKKPESPSDVIRHDGIRGSQIPTQQNPPAMPPVKPPKE